VIIGQPPPEVVELLERLAVEAPRAPTPFGDPEEPGTERLAAVLARLRTGSPRGFEPAEPSGERAEMPSVPIPTAGGLRALAALGETVPAGGEAREREPLPADLLQEDFASRLDRLLRREALRHGIEVDEP
jgi:hypothetical protein